MYLPDRRPEWTLQRDIRDASEMTVFVEYPHPDEGSARVVHDSFDVKELCGDGS